MKQYIVDAFAQQVFQGNPAAVCVLDKWLTESLMQRIAAENNLSETAFVLKEKDRYAIRWFTPAYEIDLCGHATLASAFVIHHFVEPAVERIRFQSQSGELTVVCDEERYTLDFPARPAKPIAPFPELADALHIEVEEAYLARDLMVVVPEEHILRELTPDFTKMAALSVGDGIIVTAKGETCDFVSRCFYPKCGVPEDPVTGSAHCNLIPYWSQKLGKRKMVARQLSSRGGTLFCRDLRQRVEIGGHAVLFSVAELHL